MDFALRSVLIVDDTPDIRELLAIQVEMMGLEAVTAANGRTALELMRSRPFDLVLLDIMMPELNGYKVLEEMNTEPALRRLPVIVISAIGDLDSVVRCIELGADDYMIKPFNTILLRARLEASLEKKRLRDQERSYLEAVQREQERSEQLLLNILPAPIAERLKSGEESIVDSFEAVTVLFADIEDFTLSTNNMTPRQLVRLLNSLFSEFDSIARQHGLEKIKTIGDAYMLVGGLPIARPDHATAVCAAALAMQAKARQYEFPDGKPVVLRMGIHTGPVVAGVIGTSKFSYDLWGDTVNTARRMEELGQGSAIQITEQTRQWVEEFFTTEPRGIVNVKGHGEMPAYWLTGYSGEAQ
jgi:class 3 adenylate cyclase